ncbi:MAG: hypothetical protein JKY65_27515 [Planctomycetes bacterium]|nr:hypothetical protein [Planctomycetota bacterium]
MLDEFVRIMEEIYGPESVADVPKERPLPLFSRERVLIERTMYAYAPRAVLLGLEATVVLWKVFPPLRWSGDPLQHVPWPTISLVCKHWGYFVGFGAHAEVRRTRHRITGRWS